MAEISYIIHVLSLVQHYLFTGSSNSLLFCHSETMDLAHQGETLHGMSIALEPLKQGQPEDTSHGPSTEGKKLRQYMAAIFGKNQGCSTSMFASLTLLKQLVCTIFC